MLDPNFDYPADPNCCYCNCDTTSSDHGTTKTAPPSEDTCHLCSEHLVWKPATGHWYCGCGIHKSGEEYSGRLCEVCDIMRASRGNIMKCRRCGQGFNIFG